MPITEAHTRKQHIDRQLARAGWDVDDSTQVVQEFDILLPPEPGVAETRGAYRTRQFSDYALIGKDGRPLAVVEAKRASADAALGREQAKQYALAIQQHTGGELPFCFYANGTKAETHGLVAAQGFLLMRAPLNPHQGVKGDEGKK